MNAAALLTYYERIADAPDSIERLRSFVIELAIRGRLIATEGRWIETTLGDIGEWGSGGTPLKAHPEYYNGDIPWLVIGDLNDGIVKTAETFITQQGLDNSSAKLVEPGTVLIAMYGSIGKLGIAGIRCATNQAIAFCVPKKDLISIEFLFLLLRGLREHLLARGQGVAQQNISQKILKAYPVSLAPLAEQHRIVAKVDELMALCDQLEAARLQREATRGRLAAASLARLNTPDPETFQADARFAIGTALPALTTRPDQIKQLRQTILNLAVRGRLVSQNSSHEATSKVLSRYNLAAQPVAAFEIPSSWAWVNVGAVADCRLGKMLDRAKNRGTPKPYLRNINVRWFDFDLSDLLEMPFEEDELDEFSLRAGDVLICEGGEPGRAAVWDERAHGLHFQKAIHRARFRDFVSPHFFVMAIRQSAWAGRLSESFTGTGIQHFTGRGLSAYCFPLPPLPEQRRIVAKVDELMSLCDQLEVSLSHGENTRSRLLNALLHEALAPADTALEAA